ncbi:hypothetical protein D3C81_1086970 [compost metagenome]
MRVADQGVEALGVVVMQRGQLAADAVRRIERQQGVGEAVVLVDRRCVQQQCLAMQGDFAQRQAEALFDQRAGQDRIIEQFGQRATLGRRVAQMGHRRIGEQYQAVPVDGQHRVAHGREQGVELQAAALAGEDVDHCHFLHAPYLQQRLAQFFEHVGAEGRGVDVDVRRHHLHGIQVEAASAEQRQDFLGDTDSIDEGDVDAHGKT